MPFNHNHRYHPQLLGLVPPGAAKALDVGCGHGRFARRLAARGLDVDAVDINEDMVRVTAALGSSGPGRVTARRLDIARDEIGSYDFISCLASLHHVPFETVTKLRAALRPGGVLVVLGLSRPGSGTPADLAVDVASMPVNLVARGVVRAGEWLNGGLDPLPPAPVKMEFPRLDDLRERSRELLPGATIRTVPFFRFLLTYRKPDTDHPAGG